MEELKKKIEINDLRVDKGGHPELYRRALSIILDTSSSSSASVSSSLEKEGDSFTASAPATATATSAATSSSLIDEALTLDTQRRSALTTLEGLRSQSSTLQKTVIAPKKKAGGDVTQEVAQLKEWKIQIAKLSKEVKDVEAKRDASLRQMNEVLGNANLEEIMEKIRNNGGSSSNNANGNGLTKEDGGSNDDVIAQTPKQQLSTVTSTTSNAKSASESSTKDNSATATTATTTTTTPQQQQQQLPLLSPEKIKSIPPHRILNLNVGVLGHVDTGKTSLVKTLSSVLSTASLDKSKQSRARGITLDLGFSAFLLPLPEHLTGSGGSVLQSENGAESGNMEEKGLNDAKHSANGNKNSTTNNNNNSSSSSNNSKESTTTTTTAADNSLQQKYDLLQVTLVDCPGHASLIRTIIGGAQIIDMVLLVVDATKGMQTQTAECLVIAEMTTRNLIVVLNKIDMFPEEEREERVKMAERKMRMALRGTKFEDAQMVGISACVGGEKVASVAAGGGGAASGGSSGTGSGDGDNSNVFGSIAGTNNIHGLLHVLQSQIRAPNRDAQPSPDRFHFAVDHCFPIKGQGTVLTGTCLSGSVCPNDMVEFPTLATQKKVKGLQMFRRKANIIQQGDRAGICVSNFDAKLMERGIIASPGTVKLIRGAIAVVRKVRFFRGGLNCGAKFHVSVGHTTVMATVTFWGAREIAAQESEKNRIEKNNKNNNSNNTNNPFGKSSLGGSADLAGLPRLKFDWNQDFLHQDNYLDVLPTNNDSSEWNQSASSGASAGGKRKSNNDSSALPPLHWARLEFLTPVYCPMDSLVIGSRLDSEVNANACRLAFSGRLVERYDAKSDHGRLKSYTKKEKVGKVCRLGDPYRRTDDQKIVRYEVFGTDLFKKETNMTQFVGLFIETDRGDVGSIQSSFGTSGKFRVHFPGGTDVREGDSLYLRFKRYANDPKKAIHQDGSLPPARTGNRLDPPAKKKKNKAAKNGIRNDAAASSPPQATNSVNNIMSKESQHNKAANTEVFGEIVKLKGDTLDNGKTSVAIVSGLFSMEDDITKHKGRAVICIGTNDKGEIVGSFGKMGKCKVVFNNGISSEVVGSRVKMLAKE